MSKLLAVIGRSPARTRSPSVSPSTSPLARQTTPTPVYDRFTSRAEAEAYARQRAKERELEREQQDQVALSPLEPGSGPGAGVIDYYVDGRDVERDSVITPTDEYAASDTGSYVMERDVAGMGASGAAAGGSGNMMVDRLLQDLKINNEEEIELHQRRMLTRSQAKAAATGPPGQNVQPSMQDKQRAATVQPKMTVKPGELDISKPNMTPTTQAPLATSSASSVLHEASSHLGPTPHATASAQPDEQSSRPPKDEKEDEAIEVIKDQDLGTSGSWSRADVASSEGRSSTARMGSAGPRTNKAALLRQGVQPEDRQEREIIPVDFADTPGHKRASLQVAVAALAQPTIAPRPNRATLIRSGQITPAAPTHTPRFPGPPLSTSREQARTPSILHSNEQIFADVPGHKRITKVEAPRSIDKPKVQPRPTKASMLRTGGAAENAKASGSAAFRQASSGSQAASVKSLPVHSRDEDEVESLTKMPVSTSTASKRSSMMASKPKSLAAPTVAPRPNRASMLRNPSADSVPQQSTRTASRALAEVFAGVPGHKRRESFQVASVSAPSMAPRLNRAAMLRKDPGAAQPHPTAVHSKEVFRARPLPAFYGGGSFKADSAGPVPDNDEDVF